MSGSTTTLSKSVLLVTVTHQPLQMPMLSFPSSSLSHCREGLLISQLACCFRENTDELSIRSCKNENQPAQLQNCTKAKEPCHTQHCTRAALALLADYSQPHVHCSAQESLWVLCQTLKRSLWSTNFFLCFCYSASVVTKGGLSPHEEFEPGNFSWNTFFLTILWPTSG